MYIHSQKRQTYRHFKSLKLSFPIHFCLRVFLFHLNSSFCSYLFYVSRSTISIAMSSLRGSGMRTIFEHPPECGRKDTRGYWLRREAGLGGGNGRESAGNMYFEPRDEMCTWYDVTEWTTLCRGKRGNDFISKSSFADAHAQPDNWSSPINSAWLAVTISDFTVAPSPFYSTSLSSSTAICYPRPDTCTKLWMGKTVSHSTSVE